MADILVTSSATAPALGAVIATAGTLQPGRYLVTVSGMLSGTVVAATDINNIELKVGSTVVGVDILIPVTATVFENPPVQVIVPSGGAAITVNAVAAGSVAAVYSVELLVSAQQVWTT